MSLITVDANKCDKDGLCIQECPGSIIAMTDGLPASVKEKEGFCIHCGHCVAVCPTGALTLAGIGPDKLEPINPGLAVNLDQIAQLMKSRRSERHFRPEPIPRADLEKLLDIARYAPTGVNVEDVRWLMISDKDVMARVSDLTVQGMHALNVMTHYADAYDKGRKDLITRSATTLAIAYTTTSNPLPDTNCVIAATYLELAAAAAGYGACWAGLVMSMGRYYPPLAEYLEIPEGCAVYAALMLGQPQHRFARIPRRKSLKATWR